MYLFWFPFSLFLTTKMMMSARMSQISVGTTLTVPTQWGATIAPVCQGTHQQDCTNSNKTMGLSALVKFSS